MKNRFIKENVLESLGGEGAARHFFSITRQSIAQWPAGKIIPAGRCYELMVRRPDLFPPERPVVGSTRRSNE